jgi:hypothetical protein
MKPAVIRTLTDTFEGHALQTEGAISSEHVINNDAVRETLLSRGIRPEELPATEDVKRVERRLKSEEKASLAPSGTVATL